MKKSHYLFLSFFLVSILSFSQGETPSDDAENTQNQQTYHALIIGVSKYNDDNIVPLNEPTKHAKQLSNLLTSDYNFKSENISLLLNPTRNAIIRAFYDVQKKLVERIIYSFFMRDIAISIKPQKEDIGCLLMSTWSTKRISY